MWNMDQNEPKNFFRAFDICWGTNSSKVRTVELLRRSYFGKLKDFNDGFTESFQSIHILHFKEYDMV